MLLAAGFARRRRALVLYPAPPLRQALLFFGFVLFHRNCWRILHATRGFLVGGNHLQTQRPTAIPGNHGLTQTPLKGVHVHASKGNAVGTTRLFLFLFSLGLLVLYPTDAGQRIAGIGTNRTIIGKDGLLLIIFVILITGSSVVVLHLPVIGRRWRRRRGHCCCYQCMTMSEREGCLWRVTANYNFFSERRSFPLSL